MRRTSLELSSVYIALALIVFGTAVPIEIRTAAWSLGRFAVSDFVVNILLYLPLGLALWRRSILSVLIRATAISALIELLQTWSFGRYPSVFDVLANAGGAALGALVAQRVAARVIGFRTDVVTLNGVVTAGAALVAAALLAVWSLHIPASNLASWNRDFALLLGNETTGDRPWRGSLDALALIPAALSRDEVRALSTRASDASRSQVAYVLPTPVTLQGDNALSIAPDTAHRFADLASRANAFTVVARLTAADLNQRGPARVISFSGDPFNRNFDLGQEGRAVVFRVRTKTAGPNGNNPRTETDEVLEAGRSTIVAATFDGAVARIYVDGHIRGRTNIAAAGCTVASLCDGDLPFARSVFGASMAIVALGLFRPATRRGRLAFSLGAGVFAFCALRLIEPMTHFAAIAPWADLMVFAGAGVVGAAARSGRHQPFNTQSPE